MQSILDNDLASEARQSGAEEDGADVVLAGLGWINIAYALVFFQDCR